MGVRIQHHDMDRDWPLLLLYMIQTNYSWQQNIVGSCLLVIPDQQKLSSIYRKYFVRMDSQSKYGSTRQGTFKSKALYIKSNNKLDHMVEHCLIKSL